MDSESVYKCARGLRQGSVVEGVIEPLFFFLTIDTINFLSKGTDKVLSLKKGIIWKKQ